jgi:hypothetical protein
MNGAAREASRAEARPTATLRFGAPQPASKPVIESIDAAGLRVLLADDNA